MDSFNLSKHDLSIKYRVASKKTVNGALHAKPNSKFCNKSCSKVDSAIWYFADSQALSNSTHVEGLQERTQCALEDYIRTQYPNQHTRFGKLLLRLPSLRLIRPGTLELLFFPPSALGSSVESALNEMLLVSNTSVNSWPVVNINGTM